MFLGDADQKAGRIREASIKGALAFWWRALVFSKFVQDAGGGQAAALKTMQAREQHLFGGDQGQGVFLLKIVDGPDPKDVIAVGEKLEKNGETLDPNNKEQGDCVGTQYLGFGLMKASGSDAVKLTRSCIKAGQTFTLRLAFRRGAEKAGIDEVIRALKLFGLLGGLGSRVRRGWGSVALQHLELCETLKTEERSWDAPASRKAYMAALKGIIGNDGGLPAQSGAAFELSAFASETDIRVGTAESPNALAVLDDAGNAMQKYRGWLGQGQQHFHADHKWFKAGSSRLMGASDVVTDKAGDSYSVKQLPQRTVFGLPHNYYSNKKGNILKMNVGGPTNEQDRRASPLFIHIHRTSNGKAFGALSLFPTQFLPGETAKIKVNRDNRAFVPDMNVISNFLEGNTPKGIKNPKGVYFPSEKLFP